MLFRLHKVEAGPDRVDWFVLRFVIRPDKHLRDQAHELAREAVDCLMPRTLADALA